MTFQELFKNKYLNEDLQFTTYYGKVVYYPCNVPFKFNPKRKFKDLISFMKAINV